jgi:environmental stress-induced protein Ves
LRCFRTSEESARFVISILRAADRIALPWKNGGGVTREVAVWPPGSGFDDFDWRVSIAEVRVAGPFSRFVGIDRTMTILEGRLALTMMSETFTLDSASAPFTFPGDVSCFGEPVDGSVMDLNAMTRRGRATARVMPVSDGAHSASGKSTLLLVRNETNVRLGGQEFYLAPLDALLIGGPSELALDGAAFLIAIA